jgi:hypothetical protein
MREKLIELLDDAMFFEGYGRELCEQQADHLIANGVVISKMETVATDNNKWIPVTERLPEDLQKVLCFKQAKYGSCVMTANFSECLEKYCDVDFCGVKHGGFFSYDSEVGYYELREVTHWMPLPEPPKGD